MRAPGNPALRGGHDAQQRQTQVGRLNFARQMGRLDGVANFGSSRRANGGLHPIQKTAQGVLPGWFPASLARRLCLVVICHIDFNSPPVWKVRTERLTVWL